MATNASLAATVAIVTGVSPGGIGLEIALGLCRRGATVVIGSRDPRRATAALETIRGDGAVVAAGGRVEWISLDLAQLRDVGRFVDEFRRRYTQLHLLVNNAGLNTIGNPGARSEDGFELCFAVNFLGAMHLTDLLLPLLRASAPARIVNVASSMHRKGVLAELRQAPYNATATSYSNSKLAVVLYTYELQRRLRETGEDEAVKVFAVNPGGVMTDIWRGVPRCVWFLAWPLAKAVLLTPAKGAETALYAATVEGMSGGVYVSPYHGTLSYPHVFDYVSLYGGPRVCPSSPDSYSWRQGREFVNYAADLVQQALRTGPPTATPLSGGVAGGADPGGAGAGAGAGGADASPAAVKQRSRLPARAMAV